MDLLTKIYLLMIQFKNKNKIGRKYNLGLQLYNIVGLTCFFFLAHLNRRSKELQFNTFNLLISSPEITSLRLVSPAPSFFFFFSLFQKVKNVICLFNLIIIHNIYFPSDVHPFCVCILHQFLQTLRNVNAFGRRHCKPSRCPLPFIA